MRKRSLFAVLGLLLVLWLATTLKFPFAEPIKNFLAEGFNPFLEFTSRLERTVELLVDRTKTYTRLQMETTEMKRQVVELSARVARAEELERENQRFSALLAFKKRSPMKLIPARVIGRDASNFWSALLVDRGAADGVERDMPVLTVEGLVGRTIEVEARTARVLLIVDENCRVPAWLGESSQYGIVEGNALAGGSASRCRMRFVDRAARVKAGEKVFTSGLGQIYPKGILIGTVGDVVPASDSRGGGMYQELFITPAVDLARIDEVFVEVGVQLPEKSGVKPPEKARR